MEELVIERRVHWNRAARQVAPQPAVVTVPAQTARPKLTTARPRSVQVPHATANYSRPLTEREETIIKTEFLKLNGIFEPLKKDCTRIKDMLGNDVTVFQVSGYVTKLHRLATGGSLAIQDRRAYLATLRSHRKHWLTYQGEKYEEMRERVEANGPKPKFAARAPHIATTATPRHRMGR